MIYLTVLNVDVLELFVCSGGGGLYGSWSVLVLKANAEGARRGWTSGNKNTGHKVFFTFQRVLVHL